MNLLNKLKIDKYLILAAILLCNVALASEIKTTANAGKVEFEAIGRPSMIKIKGIGEGVNANLKVNVNKISGEAVFRLDSLTTGIEMRDEHMKEKYLQVKNYPDAKMVFNEFQMPAGWTIKSPKVATSSFRGKLILHGVEREITGLYTLDAQAMKSTASFEVKLSDFKIEIPTYLGVKVADIVKISISLDKINIIQ
ncbi:MAG: YceI family protein [Pseudobdellovibrio sp.]